MVDVRAEQLDTKIDSPGKRGFLARAVRAAEKEFVTTSAAAASSSDKPALTNELLNIFIKDPVKVGS